jgi:hypothetical protein
MRSIPAFSKKTSNGPTITSGPNKQRAGFTDNVKTTKVSGPVSTSKGLVKGASGFGSKTYKGGPSIPSHSGKAAKSVPAFSKKKI